MRNARARPFWLEAPTRWRCPLRYAAPPLLRMRNRLLRGQQISLIPSRPEGPYRGARDGNGSIRNGQAPALPPSLRHFDRSRAEHGGVEKPCAYGYEVSPLRASRSGRNDGVGVGQARPSIGDHIECYPAPFFAVDSVRPSISGLLPDTPRTASGSDRTVFRTGTAPAARLAGRGVVFDIIPLRYAAPPLLRMRNRLLRDQQISLIPSRPEGPYRGARDGNGSIRNGQAPALPPSLRHFDRSRAEHGGVEKPCAHGYEVSPLRASRSGRNDGVGVGQARPSIGDHIECYPAPFFARAPPPPRGWPGAG